MATVEEATERAVRRFERDAARALAVVVRRIAREAKGLPRGPDGKILATTDAIARARVLGEDLAAQLSKARPDLAEAWRTASASVAIASAQDAERRGLVSRAGDLVRVSEDALVLLRGDGLDRLETLQGAASEAVRRAVVDSVLAGEQPARLVEAVRAGLDTTIARATTLVDTTAAAMDREVMSRAAEEAGVEAWLYDGPQDRLTRPWCSPRVGRLFSTEQRDREPNDTGPNPPSAYGGGWNCRHRWVPMTETRGYRWYYGRP